MSRVLVTGASGLIGRHAVARLRALGFEVAAAGRDLLDPADRARIVERTRATHLLHLAWETRHGYFWTAPENRAWAEASADLARRFLDAGGRCIAAAGSCAEALEPASPYGRAKSAFREMLSGTGAPFVWGRVYFLYGAGEHPDRLVAAVARALVRGQPALCTSGRQVRDFLDARDVGAMLAEALAGDAQGIVEIGSGEGHSVAEVARMLGELAGWPDLIRLGALPDRADEPPALVAAAPWRAPAIPLRQGLADALAWWRTQE